MKITRALQLGVVGLFILIFLGSNQSAQVESGSRPQASSAQTIVSNQNRLITTDLTIEDLEGYQLQRLRQDPASLEQAIATEKRIQAQLAKYQSAWLQSINLQKIVVVAEIISPTGNSVLGLANPEQGVIYLTVYNRASDLLEQTTLHHELAHLLMEARQLSLTDSLIWGRQDESVQNENYFFPAPGYVTTYAMKSAEEDLAEVFAYMQSDLYADMLLKANHDERLWQKMAFVRDQIN